MTLRQFIGTNRAELETCISKALNHVPRQAGCDCPKRGTDHYHTDHDLALSTEQLRQWILNDEGLYNWARSEGVRI